MQFEPVARPCRLDLMASLLSSSARDRRGATDSPYKSRSMASVEKADSPLAFFLAMWPEHLADWQEIRLGEVQAAAEGKTRLGRGGTAPGCGKSRQKKKRGG